MNFSTSANSTISSNRRVDLRPPHAEDRAVQVDVLAPGQLGVEAGADLEQRADAAGDLGPAGGRLGDARQDLEQRALAGAVAADDPDHLARTDLERDVAQRPDPQPPFAAEGPCLSRVVKLRPVLRTRAARASRRLRPGTAPEIEYSFERRWGRMTAPSTSDDVGEAASVL